MIKRATPDVTLHEVITIEVLFPIQQMFDTVCI